MIHPIESMSYEILEGRVDLSGLETPSRAVVARVIHASADPEYATTVVAPVAAIAAAVDVIRAGGPVVADVEMTRVAITGVEARCYLPDTPVDGAATRSAAGMRLAAQRHPDGALFVIGCAPTALTELLDLVRAGWFLPAAVIAMPVGFVGAAAAKARALTSDLPVIANRGEKGGAAVAAAACNAIVRLARA